MSIPLFAADALGDALKVVQIGFYVIGATVAILTYRAAKRGLLNTVNTEYQKRVMDRLAKLSEDLFSEFDPTSNKHWSNARPIEAILHEINEVFERNREEILELGEYPYGIMHTGDVSQLHGIIQGVVSDPFIPETIREAAIDLLENRLAVIRGVYWKEFDKYSKELAKGKRQPITDLEEQNKLQNRIIDQLNKQGCGIPAIEQEVHELRGLIQDYFESFNPHRRWWERRPRRRKPVEEPAK